MPTEESTGDDEDLLRQYVDARSQTAFCELVYRHTDLVWSSALRLVGGDPHMAEDVAQVVFAALAMKASGLKRGVSLPGWLLNATRYAAADLLKAERRRKRHERKVAMIRAQGSEQEANDGSAAGDSSRVGEELTTEEGQTWSRVAPVLDDALSQLSDSLRHAVILRFFERKSMRDVAERLGISEAAARQRVCRGLDKLREALGRKSVGVPLTILAPLLTTHAVKAAPPGLASTVASAGWLASSATATAMGFAGGSAVSLVGIWAKGSAAACVLVALLASAGALVAWELARNSSGETVEIAPPAPQTADARLRLAPALGQPVSPNSTASAGDPDAQPHIRVDTAKGLVIYEKRKDSSEHGGPRATGEEEFAHPSDPHGQGK